MANTLKIKLYYQACEEVLTSTVWYVQTTGGTQINPAVHRDLAREVRDAAQAGWTAFAAKGCICWAVAVEVPKQAPAVDGPYRFMASSCFESVALMEAMPDSVTQIATLEGTNTSGDPVRGGVRMACIPEGGIDGNILDAAQSLAFNTFFNAVWKPIWTISSGESFTRVVKSTHEFELTEYVPCPTNTINRRAGTRLDRVLNRPQCRPDRIEV